MSCQINYKAKLALFGFNAVDTTVFVTINAHLLAAVLSRGTISLDEFQQCVSSRSYARYKSSFLRNDGYLYVTVHSARVL